MNACPKRLVLYTKLREDKDGGEPESPEDFDKILDEWLAALDQILSRINAFYDANNYKKGLNRMTNSLSSVADVACTFKLVHMLIDGDIL